MLNILEHFAYIFAQQKCTQKEIFASNTFLHQMHFCTGKLRKQLETHKKL